MVKGHIYRYKVLGTENGNSGDFELRNVNVLSIECFSNQDKGIVGGRERSSENIFL